MSDTDAPFRSATVALLLEFDEVEEAWDQELRHPKQAQYDVGARLRDGKIAAVEVTRLLDQYQASTHAGYQQGKNSWQRNGAGAWVVEPADASINLNRLSKKLNPC